MKIKIETEKDLRKFYRRIPLYRSILYNRVTFELNNDTYHITPIIKALNIKNRKKRIEYIYDEAIKTIDDYYKNVKNIV